MSDDIGIHGSGAAARKTFRRNVGGIDRAIRFAVGAALAAGGLLQLSRGDGGVTEVILGAVILVMAAIGICPLYLPFGISTARTLPNSQKTKAGAEGR